MGACLCRIETRVDQRSPRGSVPTGAFLPVSDRVQTRERGEIIIIEAGIGIVEIAAVAEGVDVRDMGGVSGNIDTGPVQDGEDIPPGVVEILRDEGAVRVEDAVNRPDGVAEIEVVGAVQREALEFLIAAVIEIQHVAAGLDAAEAVSVPIVGRPDAAHGLGPPQALVVIGIRRGRAVFRQLV